MTLADGSGTMSNSDVGISDVQVVPRTTCLSCEQDGKATSLVPFGHWRVCPIHERDLFLYSDRLRRLRQMEQLVKR